MKVRELMNRLQQYSDDCDVFFHHMEIGVVDLKINDFDRTIDVIVFEPQPEVDGSFQQIDIIAYFEDEGE